MKSKKDVTESAERCATGVLGFDKLCEGGLIGDSINLVVGNAGAGKTTFLLQFLYNGATQFDENGLYVSFEPEITDLYKAGRMQGMDFEKIQDKVSFLKMDTDFSVKEAEEKLSKLVTKNNIKRICFDPINVFAVDLPKEVNMRRQVYEMVGLLKKLDVCVIIAGEADEEKQEGYGLADEITFLKYLVDGVIELFSSGLTGEGDRALRISKMRMTRHFRGPVGMEITDSGVRVLKK